MRTLFWLSFLVCVTAGCQEAKPTTIEESTMTAAFDWQGHRGARGLMPENTIPAFLEALKYPAVTTLELDVAISADSQVIVSHEPWMSNEICSRADGQPIEEAEAQQYAIYRLSYAEIQTFDCGSRGHERFPQQQEQAVAKPSLADVVAAVNRAVVEQDRQPPLYNIEIKSRPDWDDQFTPTPNVFAQLLIDELKRLQIKDKTTIQSFDIRSLQAARAIDPTITLAYLIEEPANIPNELNELGFVPEIYSPYYINLTKQLVEKAHEHGMQVIPWTVNDVDQMEAMIRLGVDGIITDYPNLIERVKR